MKEKLRITSKLPNTEFVARANIGGTWWVLTDKTFSLVTAGEFDTNPSYRDERVLSIPFSPMNKYWEMDYDTDDKPTPLKPGRHGSMEDELITERITQENKINKNKRISVKEFFARHPQLEHGTDFGVDYVPTGQTIAVVELVTQKSKKLHLADRKKALVFAIIDAMPWDKQYDVALYYAPELAGKRRSDVLHGLVGLKDVGTDKAHLGGKMWQKIVGSNATYADDFLNHYLAEGNNTVIMKIYVEKAIHYGVITKGNGGLYINGGTTFLGATSTDAVLYLTKDMETYTNIIQSEVNKRGSLPDDDMEGEDPVELPLRTIWEQNKMNAMGTAEYKQDYFRLMTRFKELGGSWPNEGMRYRELKEAVAKQEASVLAAKTHDSLPTSQLNTVIDPSSPISLDALKEQAKEVGVRGYQHFKSITALKEAISKKIEENKAEGVTN